MIFQAKLKILRRVHEVWISSSIVNFSLWCACVKVLRKFVKCGSRTLCRLWYKTTPAAPHSKWGARRGGDREGELPETPTFPRFSYVTRKWVLTWAINTESDSARLQRGGDASFSRVKDQGRKGWRNSPILWGNDCGLSFSRSLSESQICLYNAYNYGYPDITLFPDSAVALVYHSSCLLGVIKNYFYF